VKHSELLRIIAGKSWRRTICNPSEAYDRLDDFHWSGEVVMSDDKQRSQKKWSAEVTRRSDALDLEAEVFKKSPTGIAQSLKRSAERSKRRKSSPYQSAMSMLTFYINRAGKKLSPTRRKKLEAAKDKLRKAFGRDD